MAKRMTEQEIQEMIDIIEDYYNKYGKIWSRKVLYELVSHQLIKDTSRSQYTKVSRLFTNLRRDGRVPYDWFRDKKTVEKDVGIRESYTIDEWFDCFMWQYERPSQIYQKNYVEVWTEKELADPIQWMIKNWEIGLLTSQGFVGDVAQYYALKRLNKISSEYNKPITILYISDYDCEGEHIFHLTKEKFKEYGISVVKLALNKDEVKANTLISNLEYREKMLKPKTIKSHLSKSYVREFFESNKDLAPDGIVQYELDALPVPELKNIMHKAISSLIDCDIIQNNKMICMEEVREWKKQHYK